MKAFEVASQQPWLIRAEMLDTILDICSRDNVITAEVLGKIDAHREAVATQRSRGMDGARYVDKRQNGIAVVNITGPIVRYADMFTEMSGGTSLQHLAMDIQAAIDDPSVRGVVLNIDSPGGEATGIHELANVIYSARGKKPIAAYAEGWTASAAYWLASAADEIVTDATAMLGSIGTVFSVPDPSAEKKRRIEIVSEQSPKKRPDVATEGGRSELQRWANELTNVFVDSVARNRGVTAETVLADFGQGGIRIGQDAVDHGMADRLGSLESLIAELGRPRVAVAQTNQRKGAFMSLTNGATAEEIATVENQKILALQKRLDEAEARANASEREAKEAQEAKLTTEAKAKVEGWAREGVIAGNATAEVLGVYTTVVTGKPVSAESFEKMIAAMPKIDGSRIASDAKPIESAAAGAPTKEDFLAFESGDKKASAKVNAYVTKLHGANAKKSFTKHLADARIAAFAAAK